MKQMMMDPDNGLRVSAPMRCIYCSSTDEITDEHVVPYALSKNSHVFLKASCKTCANIIQPYEQFVLRVQLGIFRAYNRSPSRSKKSKTATAALKFFATTECGEFIKDLRRRYYPIAELPFMLSLLVLPEAGMLKRDGQQASEEVITWTLIDTVAMNRLIQKVASSAC